MIIREEGEFTFWTVERKKTYGGPGWHVVGDFQIAQVPNELVWTKGRMKEPFRSFEASGEVWQRTSNHGFIDKAPADALFKLIAKYNPKDTFRVVKVCVSLSYEQIAQVYTPNSLGELKE